jgi:hypothetical protein
MVTDSGNVERLRARRQALADDRHQTELRRTAAPRLVAIVSSALGQALSIEDFVQQGGTIDTFIWPPRIEDAPGLVAAYVDGSRAENVLSCISRRLGGLTGYIGFHDKAYLGFARVAGIELTALFEIADASKDSVLFYVDHPKGAVLVDCYEDPGGNPYSVIVQGNLLIAEATDCFDKL